MLNTVIQPSIFQKKYVDIDIAVSRENNTKVILKWRNISLFSDDDYFVLDSGET